MPLTLEKQRTPTTTIAMNHESVQRKSQHQHAAAAKSQTTTLLTEARAFFVLLTNLSQSDYDNDHFYCMTTCTPFLPTGMSGQTFVSAWLILLTTFPSTGARPVC